MHRFPTVFLISTVLTFILIFPGAGAAESPGSNGLELALGAGYRSQPESNTYVTSLGLRYSHRFAGRWGFEVSGQWQDELTFNRGDAVFVDLSARLDLYENERIELFTFFGPGVVFYDSVSTLNFDTGVIEFKSDEDLTFHAGLGLDVKLGDRYYLRPDLRYRRFDQLSEPVDDDVFESTIALGFRF